MLFAMRCMLTVKTSRKDLLNGRGKDDDPNLGVERDAVDGGMELLPEAIWLEVIC